MKELTVKGEKRCYSVSHRERMKLIASSLKKEAFEAINSRRRFVMFFPAITLCIINTPVWSTAIINGDFAAGDFSSWTVTAFDAGDNPINPNPFINVTTLGANNVVQFETGQFDDGLFVATLEQTFTVSVTEPFLNFDFTRAGPEIDPTGGNGSFFDSVVVSVGTGADSFTLLLVDQFQVTPDPFGTAPGAVALSVPIAADFDFNLTADLTSLAFEEITLFFDVINEDDGFQLNMLSGNIRTESSPQTRVPEPNNFMLLAIGISIWLSGKIRKDRKA